MRNLAVTLAAMTLLLLAAPAAAMADSGGCNRLTTQTGVCQGASVGNGGVDLSADREVNTPGRQGSGSGNGRGGDGGEGSGDGEWDGLPDGVSRVPGGVPVDQGDASAGPGTGPRRTPIVAPADPAVPVCQPQTPCDPDLVVRVSDLVSIPAAAPTQGMEPNGWLVVGVPVLSNT